MLLIFVLNVLAATSANREAYGSTGKNSFIICMFDTATRDGFFPKAFMEMVDRQRNFYFYKFRNGQLRSLLLLKKHQWHQFESIREGAINDGAENWNLGCFQPIMFQLQHFHQRPSFGDYYGTKNHCLLQKDANMCNLCEGNVISQLYSSKTITVQADL